MRKLRLTFESERLVFQQLSMRDLDLEIELWTDLEVVKFITGEVATEEDVADQMPVVTQRAGDGCIGI